MDEIPLLADVRARRLQPPGAGPVYRCSLLPDRHGQPVSEEAFAHRRMVVCRTCPARARPGPRAGPGADLLCRSAVAPPALRRFAGAAPGGLLPDSAARP